MSNIDDQIKTLDKRLKAADVELIDADEKLYEVFVPGALRERTRVKADSEEEAIEKTRGVLVAKLQHYAVKPEGTGESDGELQVDSVRQGNAAQNAGGEA